KPDSADGTALETVWESRTPPDHTSRLCPRPRTSGGGTVMSGQVRSHDRAGRPAARQDGRVNRVDLLRARAHWLTRDLLAVPEWVLPEGSDAEDLTWTLGVAPDGGLDPTAPVPAQELALRLSDGALPAPAAGAYPHLAA